MQSWRKFWGRVTAGRWKVLNSGTGKVIGSYWKRSTADDVSSGMNEALQYIGSKSSYVVRWM